MSASSSVDASRPSSVDTSCGRLIALSAAAHLCHHLCDTGRYSFDAGDDKAVRWLCDLALFGFILNVWANGYQPRQVK